MRLLTGICSATTGQPLSPSGMNYYHNPRDSSTVMQAMQDKDRSAPILPLCGLYALSGISRMIMALHGTRGALHLIRGPFATYCNIFKYPENPHTG
jgi:hypothetical protein